MVLRVGAGIQMKVTNGNMVTSWKQNENNSKIRATISQSFHSSALKQDER